MDHTNGSKAKVFWTDAERSIIISKAVDIQRESPELAGLPLLRAAMMALSPARRREVVAMSQVSWFESGVRREARRREDVADVVPGALVTMIGELTKTSSMRFDVLQKLVEQTEDVGSEIAQSLHASTAMLALVYQELKMMNDRFGACYKIVNGTNASDLASYKRPPTQED